jgi:hypothetical protein
MTSWARTADGWAVNLDGTDAAREYSLPRVELHSGPHGWTCECHLPGGNTQPLAIGSPEGLAAAKRAAIEAALAALGAPYEAALRPLL